MRAKDLKTFTLAVLLATLPAESYGFSVLQPLNGCTFYKPRLVPEFGRCGQFSAVRGRSGCRKVKGICPACVTYPGDDVQMWLPDYFIEVTRHIGRSMFAENFDGVALAAQLAS